MFVVIPVISGKPVEVIIIACLSTGQRLSGNSGYEDQSRRDYSSQNCHRKFYFYSE